jgi:hypothetical protein
VNSVSRLLLQVVVDMFRPPFHRAAKASGESAAIGLRHLASGLVGSREEPEKNF